MQYFPLIKKLIGLFVGLLIFLNIHALPTLPVPSNLIAFDSATGIKLLKQSQHKVAFWKLMPYFTTEKGLAFCGIASAVMVLNALNIEPPLTPEHAPYRIFNQDNFFNAKTLKITTPAMVNYHGVSLAEMSQALDTFAIKATSTYGSKITEKGFRKAAIAAVDSTHQFILVNFCRKYINEKGCGHFSPLAAYNAKTDRFLLLDVARYKYPPVWVKTADLYKSISTGLDSASNKSRGFILAAI